MLRSHAGRWREVDEEKMEKSIRIIIILWSGHQRSFTPFRSESIMIDKSRMSRGHEAALTSNEGIRALWYLTGYTSGLAEIRILPTTVTSEVSPSEFIHSSFRRHHHHHHRWWLCHLYLLVLSRFHVQVVHWLRYDIDSGSNSALIRPLLLVVPSFPSTAGQLSRSNMQSSWCICNVITEENKAREFFLIASHWQSLLGWYA